MRLELGSFPVREVELGARPTGYRDGVLTIDRAELTRALLADRRLRGVTLDVVRPGENVRVIHLLDAVEPRVKVSGGGAVFPGFLGSAEPVGGGRTHRLAGVAVLQQNNPVVLGLSRRHGRDLDFARVVVARTLSPLPEEKQRNAAHAAKLATLLGAQGIVNSHDSGGNAVIELMSACRECERRGIRTVLLSEEFSGPDGRELGLVHHIPEANAMVSTGNRDEVLALPAVERLIGGREILNIALNDTPVPGPASAAFSTALRRIFCATNQVGFGSLELEAI